jgi:hypothetical protein
MEMPDDFWNWIVNPILGYHDGKREKSKNKISTD